MKNLFFAVIAVALMSTNAYAVYVEGTVAQIKTTDTTNQITISRASDRALLRLTVSDTLTADQLKLYMAIALTAKTTGSTVAVSGTTDLTDIIIK
ncbi:MAG: hypothetical protein KZQ70_13715 [gamma proteobacterium symbiont of Lucinoma myriamae]|nr:hypothetical protein [gamma proteobacterium symbiont of Lucinoma myriamae]MCU7818139.1 hypothetical protein [gamma proteobacterium symbiont of Lucinoma myriamae]